MQNTRRPLLTPFNDSDNRGNSNFLLKISEKTYNKIISDILALLATALVRGSSEDVSDKSTTTSRNTRNQDSSMKFPTNPTLHGNRSRPTKTTPEASLRVSDDKITEDWPEIQPEDKEDVFDWRLSKVSKVLSAMSSTCDTQ